MKITNDSLIAAMFLFEKENGIKLDQNSIQEIEKEGLAKENPLDLVTAIKNYIELSPNEDPLLGTAIFALGKRYDKNLKRFFVKILRRLLDSNPHALFQALIALNNLEENALPDDASATEYELNRKFAINYLKRVA